MEFKILLLVLILSTISFTQENSYPAPDKPDNSWLIAGIGYGNNDHLSFTAAYTFSGKIIYKLSIDGNSTFDLFGSELGESVNSISFTAGKKIELEYLLLAGYIGPSYVNGKYHNKTESGFGGKIGFQFVLLPTYELGIGIDLFQNFNTYKNFSGLRFVLFLRSSR